MDSGLTSQISEGDMSNPDTDTFDGEIGQYSDKQIFIANDQSALSGDITASDTVIQINSPMFATGDILIIDSELMKVIDGGGTSILTVERNMYGSGAAVHSSGTVAYAACKYTNLSVAPIDTASTDESFWVTLALTQAELDTREPGTALSFQSKGHNETLSFWRRITVPPGTPVQNKVDIKLRLSGIESLV